MKPFDNSWKKLITAETRWEQLKQAVNIWKHLITAETCWEQLKKVEILIPTNPVRTPTNSKLSSWICLTFHHFWENSTWNFGGIQAVPGCFSTISNLCWCDLPKNQHEISHLNSLVKRILGYRYTKHLHPSPSKSHEDLSKSSENSWFLGYDRPAAMGIDLAES